MVEPNAMDIFNLSLVILPSFEMSDFIERLKAFDNREKLPRDSVEMSFPDLLNSRFEPIFVVIEYMSDL